MSELNPASPLAVFFVAVTIVAISHNGNNTQRRWSGMVKKYLNSRTHKPELSDSVRSVTSPDTFAAW